MNTSPVVPPDAEHETVPIVTNDDVVRARQLVRTLAQRCKLSLVDQTKLVTAASELARNTWCTAAAESCARAGAP